MEPNPNVVHLPNAVPGEDSPDHESILKRDLAIASVALHKGITLQEAADEVQGILDKLTGLIDRLVKE